MFKDGRTHKEKIPGSKLHKEKSDAAEGQANKTLGKDGKLSGGLVVKNPAFSAKFNSWSGNWESTSLRATKHEYYNYWAHRPQLESLSALLERFHWCNEAARPDAAKWINLKINKFISFKKKKGRDGTGLAGRLWTPDQGAQIFSLQSN